MSAKPLPVEPVAQANEEATPAMLQAVAEITDDDRAGPFVPHDEVMRRLREHHARE